MWDIDPKTNDLKAENEKKNENPGTRLRLSANQHSQTQLKSGQIVTKAK